MSSDRNSYTSIIKAISLFGGLKVIQILISIIRSKVIAVLIGPGGMGIANLLISTTSIISSISGFGLETSAVREISKAYSSNDNNKINRTVSSLRKIIWVSGILGTTITFILSPVLSELAFGNKEHIVSFKIISIILLFNQLNVGKSVLLQGTFNYKFLAKSALYGNLIALFLSLPLYYFWREKGIVPAIAISALITLLFTWIYSKKIPFKKIRLSLSETLIEAREMVILGFVLALVGLVGQLSGYLMNISISHLGSISDVGLYTAGYSIANTYVFLILSSMSTDYIPRLSAFSHDEKILSDIINKQAILLITLITPLIIIFIVFIKEIVITLYSKEFLPIIGMIEWFMFGMLFRAISWTLSYSFIAKGDAKIFFFYELFISIISLFLNIIGYKWLGFTGLGLSFICTYIIYLIQMYYLSNKRFNFSFSHEFYQILFPQLILSFICITMAKLVGYLFIRYLIGTIILCFSLIFTYSTIDKQIGIKLIIISLKQKIFGKDVNKN